MTVIAYSPGLIAIDRQVTNGSHKFARDKFTIAKDGAILLFSGDYTMNAALTAWYNAGRIPADWPAVQTQKDFTRMIVARVRNFGPEIEEYEYMPHPMRVPADKCMAWGDGREFAVGAMLAGADAARAIELCTPYMVNCGMGVDKFYLEV